MLPSIYFEKLAAYVAAHGFDTDTDAAGRLVILIPYIDRENREGIEAVAVSTFAEARAALGY